MIRRALLAIPFVLAACSPPGTPPLAQFQNAVTQAQQIDAALIRVVVLEPPALWVQAHTTPEAVTALLVQAKGALDALAGVTAPPTEGITLTVAVAYLEQALVLMEPIAAKGNAQAATLIQAAEVTLPLVVAFAPQGVRVGLPRHRMTEAQAKVVLAGVR